MIRNLFLLGVLMMTVLVAQAGGQPSYAVTAIAPGLLKNANMVKRVEEESFTLKNPGEAIYRHKYAFTILNENGDDYAGFMQFYDKFMDLRSIEGALYDANGNELKRLKKKDLQDLSAVSDISLMEDTRRKVHNFYHRVYPYTVEYEYEVKYNGTMFYPDWSPQLMEKVAVEQSRFVFSCPADYTFRYKAFQYTGEPVITNDKGMKVYTWQIKALPAVIKEPYSPAFRNLTPVVLFGPTQFEMQNYKGNMQSWQDLGKFMYSLRQGRDVLPDDVKARVHQLTDNVSDPTLKVKLLYEYLQQNTRYISIQLGIGGWQPFDAKYVAGRRYGDCKALSNYMSALLKEAGINSNYTLINAGGGRERIFADFPSAQFNHAILCVPLPNDTIWLECTSQTRSAGYMGTFTGNRLALLVDENGGKLVRTPVYKAADNLQVRKISATLQDDATLRLKATNQYRAQQQDQLQGAINYLAKDKLKEYLHDRFDFATYDINQFNYTEEKGSLPVVKEQLDITVSNYATITGKRLFIIPNIMSRASAKPAIDNDRRFPVEMGIAYIDIDSVEISLPKGYTIESLPQDVIVSSQFGKYSCSVKLKDDKLFYYRRMEEVEGRFPAAEYNELVKFYEAIYKADRNRVVLVKSETPAKAF